ncbi:XRE family transcriptional regulator [bacterium 1xD42-67]|nr:XRE family transcriptional regulator [bacterium 1xD42-67]
MRRLRRERKIPLKELCKYLDISIRGYQFYESEDNEPNIKTLIALADFYGVTIDYLVGRTDERS